MAKSYASFLYGLWPHDALTFAVVALLLLAVAIMSRLIPRLTANGENNTRVPEKPDLGNLPKQ